MSTRGKYRCRKCGYRQDETFSACPQCGARSTAVRTGIIGKVILVVVAINLAQAVLSLAAAGAGAIKGELASVGRSLNRIPAENPLVTAAGIEELGKEYGGFWAQDGFSLWWFWIDVTNESSEQMLMYDLNLSVYDENGSYVEKAALDWNYDSYNLPQTILPAGRSGGLSYIIELPEGCREITFELSSVGSSEDCVQYSLSV